jgi:hypothetical protein
MMFQEILDKCMQLSVDEKLQVIELLCRSIRETLQAQTLNNSADADAVTPSEGR